MKCLVCGHFQTKFHVKSLTSAQLARSWKLSPQEVAGFNRRESSSCDACGCALRSRVLAAAILKSYPDFLGQDFPGWVAYAVARRLKIAEINYFGDLHPWLKKIPGLVLSQYSESTVRARIANWLKGIRREDITQLSYPSQSFDLVLHTEVLEHLEDVDRAISECRRILKPGGFCLFTVPLLMNRLTKHADLKHPSYHGGRAENNLVYWEFGKDFISKYNLQVIIKRPQDYLYVLKLVPN